MENTLLTAFLIDSPENHISAMSLVYLAVKENSQIEENQLKKHSKRCDQKMNEVWKNPTFGLELAGTQNEGTYVTTDITITDIIVHSIQATLRRLPIGKIDFISIAEWQSIASADRKGKSGTGKRPDIMFIVNHKVRIHELAFAECSRLVCTEEKKKTDQVKLWQEMNDGLFWSRKGCKLDKGEFETESHENSKSSSTLPFPHREKQE
ncbi:25434_t:CDS:2 [Gigaspora rosea]|nr:25434_t:CDS:2 [Gigaspora rosea]